MAGLAVHKCRQQARQNAQISLRIPLGQISGGVVFQRRQPESKGVQTRTQKDDGIRCRRCHVKGATCVPVGHIPLVRTLKVLQRAGRIGCHFAVAQPVRGLRAAALGFRQRQNPAPHGGRSALRNKWPGLCHQQTQGILPGLGFNQVRHGRIRLVVVNQNLRRQQTHSL